MGEVEAQLVGSDPRSGLLDVQAQYLAQGGMQHVGGGVVAGDLLAPGLVDLQPHAVADLQATLVQQCLVQDRPPRRLLGVVHREKDSTTLALTAVADLAAALGVEGGAVEDQDALLAGGDACCLAAVDINGLQQCIGLQVIVADELAVQALDVLQDGDRLALLMQAKP